MALVEKALRKTPELVRQLGLIHARRDAGVHAVGEIWRRHRITCPTRDQLGSYLLDVLPDEQAEYITFHLEVVGCRLCQANLSDLKKQQEESSQAAETRRRKYFQSSAGYLRP